MICYSDDEVTPDDTARQACVASTLHAAEKVSDIAGAV